MFFGLYAGKKKALSNPEHFGEMSSLHNVRRRHVPTPNVSNTKLQNMMVSFERAGLSGRVSNNRYATSV